MSFARALATVSGLTVVSRLAGFVRDALTAVFLGAGPESDAFFVAQRLPNLFRSLFAEGAFAAAFVPLYTAEKERHGLASAQRFAGEAMAVLVTVLTPLTILFILAMPWVIDLIAPGFSGEPEKYAMAVHFSRITFPYLLLISITALQTGVLNARGRFGPGAAAPVMLNIVMIAGLLLSDLFGLAVGETQSWAMALAGATQALWLAISCWRARAVIPLLRPRLTESTRRLFRQIGPGAVGAGATQINLVISTMLASTLPSGAVSYLYYADRLNQLPLGIVGIAVATTLLPVLSQHEAKGEVDKVRHYVSRGVEFCLLLGLPSAIGLGLAAQPIISTLFEHGAFTHTDTVETAKALMAYALGIPAFLLIKVLASRFFARHDTRTPVRIALVSMAINVALSLSLIHVWQHVGMALATSLATWANAIILYAVLHRRGEHVLDSTFMRRLPRLLAASAAMAALTYGLAQAGALYFENQPLTTMVPALAAIIGLSSAAYAVLVLATGAFRLADIRGLIQRSAKSKGTADATHLE